MPLFPTLGWEVPRNAEEICMVTRQAILNQWAIPAIGFDSKLESYVVNEETSTFIVESYKSKFKVTIQKLEG